MFLLFLCASMCSYRRLQGGGPAQFSLWNLNSHADKLYGHEKQLKASNPHWIHAANKIELLFTTGTFTRGQEPLNNLCCSITRPTLFKCIHEAVFLSFYLGFLLTDMQFCEMRKLVVLQQKCSNSVCLPLYWISASLIYTSNICVTTFQFIIDACRQCPALQCKIFHPPFPMQVHISQRLWHYWAVQLWKTCTPWVFFLTHLLYGS